MIRTVMRQRVVVVMGAVVGIIVLAIFYPILQLQSAVRGGS